MFIPLLKVREAHRDHRTTQTFGELWSILNGRAGPGDGCWRWLARMLLDGSDHLPGDNVLFTCRFLAWFLSWGGKTTKGFLAAGLTMTDVSSSFKLRICMTCLDYLDIVTITIEHGRPLLAAWSKSSRYRQWLYYVACDRILHILWSRPLLVRTLLSAAALHLCWGCAAQSFTLASPSKSFCRGPLGSLSQSQACLVSLHFHQAGACK